MMALLKCHKCGQDLNTQVTQCLHCGTIVYEEFVGMAGDKDSNNNQKDAKNEQEDTKPPTSESVPTFVDTKVGEIGTEINKFTEHQKETNQQPSKPQVKLRITDWLIALATAVIAEVGYL